MAHVGEGGGGRVAAIGQLNSIACNDSTQSP